MTHTPAPWAIADGHAARVYLINDKHGHAIGEVVYSDTRNPADARLIAAAPDLLAQLRRIVAAADRMKTATPIDGLIDEARATIATLEG
jgi:hypothetical protein